MRLLQKYVTRRSLTVVRLCVKCTHMCHVYAYASRPEVCASRAYLCVTRKSVCDVHVCVHAHAYVSVCDVHVCVSRVRLRVTFKSVCLVQTRVSRARL